MTLDIFLDKVISKMNDNSSGRKTSFTLFNFLNIKGSCTYLAEKNSRSGAKISTIFRLSWKYFNCIIIKTF